MRNSKLKILVSTDKKYAPYCGVTLTSCFISNPESEAYVLIGERLAKKDMKRFSQLEKRFNTKIHFIYVSNELFNGAPLLMWSLPMYYRLLAPTVLPEELDRILYLDCDIVVNDDLTEFWNMDMSDHSAAVVIESDSCAPNFNHIKRLNYDASLGYFNSGMMLINLEFWRKMNVFQQGIDYLRNNKEKLVYPDQDILNYILKDTKVFVAPTYNFQTFFLTNELFKYYPHDIKSQILESKPAIAHILLKPWDIRSFSCPFYALWHKYLKLSPWHSIGEQPFKTKSVRALVKRYILWPLGLCLPDIFIDEFKSHPEWY